VGRRLVIWVEGKHDRRFLEAVAMPRLSTTYDDLLIKEYREQQRHAINGTLRSMSHQGFERLFVADRNAAPCVTNRKDKLKEHYPDLQAEEIIVVSTEIESWYLAGLTPDRATALKVKCPAYTDRLTKEDLHRLKPSQFDSERFLLELLLYFDVDTACRRNKSFGHFYQKFLT